MPVVGTSPLLNALFVWEVMYIKKMLHKHAMNGKWIVSLLLNLNFISVRVEEHLSSSTLPTTCTIASLTSLTYLRKLTLESKMLSPNATS